MSLSGSSSRLWISDRSVGNDKHCVLARLESAWSCEVQPAIDSVTRKSTHVVFGFRFGHESTLTGKFEIMPVSKVDMTFPCPRVCFPVPLQHADESLITVGIGDSVARFFLIIGLHVDQSMAWSTL